MDQDKLKSMSEEELEWKLSVLENNLENGKVIVSPVYGLTRRVDICPTWLNKLKKRLDRYRFELKILKRHMRSRGMLW